MKRRSFISSVGAAVALPAIFGKASVARSSPFYEMVAANSPVDNENILILIQLNGGNDGLNTVIPLDHYDNLAKARTSLVVPKNEIITVEDTVGLHPSFSQFADLYSNGKAGIVQSVSYPDPNLSHFRATDIWTSASGSDKYVGSGWLGRYLSIYHPDYPDAYPTEKFPDPLSLTIGSLVSTTCQGFVSNMGMAFNSFEDFYNLKSFAEGSTAETFASSHIDFINTLIEQTNIYTKSLERARDQGAGSVRDDRYPETAFGNRMKSVAHLINGGLKTKIYVVTLGGFDTHAGQVETEGESQGLHADLLEQVSHAIDGAYKDLADNGNSSKVLFMTFSEFGRRIAENASYGTDHGTAAPMFFVGDKLNPVIHGDNPVIPDGVTTQENLDMQFDYRSVYYSVLRDWFEVPEDDFSKISLEGFEYIPIIKTNSSVNDDNIISSNIKVFPNPTSDILYIEANSSVSKPAAVIDLSGRRMIDISNGQDGLDVSRLMAGIYIIIDQKGIPLTRFVKN